MLGITARDVSRFLALQAVLLVVVSMLLPLPAACVEYRPELRYGSTVFGLDYVESGMGQELFHTQTLAASDDEALAIAFPAASGGSGVSPSIGQTSDSTVAATSTGFFYSNYQFCPAINNGAPPVGVGQFAVPSPVTTARFSSHALMYPEMINTGNLLSAEDLAAGKGIKISLPPVQSNAYGPVKALAIEEDRKDVTGFEARDAGMPVILSAQNIDFDASPVEIDKTSIVERLWRNTKQGSVLGYAYEGDAAYPVWIAPLKNPKLLIDCGDGFTANRDALRMTRPGKYLTRSYWNL